MTDKEQEFEWHKKGLMDWITDGILGTDTLLEGNDWFSILRAAVDELEQKHFDLIDGHRDE